MDRQINRYIHRQITRDGQQMNRSTDRQIDRQVGRQIDRQIDTDVNRSLHDRNRQKTQQIHRQMTTLATHQLHGRPRLRGHQRRRTSFSMLYIIPLSTCICIHAIQLHILADPCFLTISSRPYFTHTCVFGSRHHTSFRPPSLPPRVYYLYH